MEEGSHRDRGDGEGNSPEGVKGFAPAYNKGALQYLPDEKDR